jgi:hypothetical protein
MFVMGKKLKKSSKNADICVFCRNLPPQYTLIFKRDDGTGLTTLSCGQCIPRAKKRMEVRIKKEGHKLEKIYMKRFTFSPTALTETVKSNQEAKREIRKKIQRN